MMSNKNGVMTALDGLDSLDLVLAHEQFLRGDFTDAAVSYSRVQDSITDDFTRGWLSCRLATIALRQGSYSRAQRICAIEHHRGE